MEAYGAAPLAGAVIKKDNGLKKTSGDGPRRTIVERFQDLLAR